MLEQSLDPGQVTGEAVRIRFVPLSVVQKLSNVLWSKNVKKHDIGGIYQSIEQYGFVDPPKWDINLNGGKGGLVFGNGRTETIVSALIEASRQGLKPPRGIAAAIESGEWCIPIVFGVDADSEAQAIALAIDHNNLTLTGSNLGLFQVAEIWDDDYLALLTEIAESDVLPVSVTEDDLAALLNGLDNNDDGADDPGDPGGQLEHTCPECGHTWRDC